MLECSLLLKMFGLGELQVCSGSSFQSRTTEGKRCIVKTIICKNNNPSLVLGEYHKYCLPNLVMPIGDPQNGYFYATRTPLIYSYKL